MYFLAIFLPPVAVLLRKGILAMLLNIVLCFFGVLPGIIHAVFIVSSTNADKRSKSLENVIRESAMFNLSAIKGSQPKESRDTVDELERLAKLKEKGHITKEEFEQRKRNILA